MKKTDVHHSIRLAAGITVLLAAALSSAAPTRPAGPDITVTFPKGTQTPSEDCGACHRNAYAEWTFGYSRINPSQTAATAKSPDPPAGTSNQQTRTQGDYPTHAIEAEAEQLACGSCHNPGPVTIPDMDKIEAGRAKGPKESATGMTCATCHLNADGKIRGPYNLRAPHETYADSKMKTSLLCASCHALGKRVPGKQTQTFYEWRDDYFMTGLGSQNCQGCHMPRTLRKLTDDAAVPARIDSRHIWIGGPGSIHLLDALSQVVVQPDTGLPLFEIHVTNVGAGHSVPTGSVRRGIYLTAEAVDKGGKKIASAEWLFAPWMFSRPDDRKHLDTDRKMPYAKVAMMADAQGPHEAPVRAGEERVLSWKPELAPGTYRIRTKLAYDANRFNDPKTNAAEVVEIGTTTLAVTVGTKTEAGAVKK